MGARPDQTAVERLEELRVRGILMRLARDGQLIDVRCEMPQCYCHRGRRCFDPISPYSDWEPTADHYPRLKMHSGRLTRDNVRLASTPGAVAAMGSVGSITGATSFADRSAFNARQRRPGSEPSPR